MIRFSSPPSSRVYLAQDDKNRSLLALKVFTFEANEERIQQEVGILQELDHPRILKAVDYQRLQVTNLGSAGSELPVLVTEYASNGDLFKLVSAFGRFPDFLARSYFHQLVDALEYLHSRNIAHGDVKLDNILVDSNFSLKLADFGMAMKYSKGTVLNKKYGTCLYFSPEKHLEEAYDPFQADLFALGIVLFVMVSGVLPFQSATENDELYSLIIEGNYEEFWQVHEKLRSLRGGNSQKGFYKTAFKELINNMLCFDPENRYTLSQIKGCEYYRDSTLNDDKLFDFVNQIATKMLY